MKETKHTFLSFNMKCIFVTLERSLGATLLINRSYFLCNVVEELKKPR